MCKGISEELLLPQWKQYWFLIFFFNPSVLRAPTFYESLAPHRFIPSPDIIILSAGEDKQNSFGITVPEEHLCQRFHNVSINRLDIVSSFLLVAKCIFCRYSCICFTENGKSWINFKTTYTHYFYLCCLLQTWLLPSCCYLILEVQNLITGSMASSWKILAYTWLTNTEILPALKSYSQLRIQRYRMRLEYYNN